ncbi:hypothetical protein K438DRAFT_2104117 [Mycena galopus ATCC 62051]|nr:hypothetical protein K438DRAFT_2104117 [Mycena galopus ATCC 62051]
MPSIVIIGAGIGGVSFAIALRRQLGFDDFIIYEKASNVGGTWRHANIHAQGACSDIPVHLYSLSTDPNPDWPSTHGLQPDTYKYWRKLTTKYNLYPRIVFNRLVTSAEWSPEDASYSIETEDIGTGKRFSTTAKIVISAIGILELPKFPDIAGVSSFKGSMFHSARWDTGVELSGKKSPSLGMGRLRPPTGSCQEPRWCMQEGVDHLVPKYTLGCKRIIRDTGFLGALHRPNLKLNWDGIQSICEEGIITKKGEKLTFDVLIFATGFTADRYPLRLIGDTNPRTIQDYYDSQGGPKAYMGTTVPGFPNLFMLAGPNTTTGHASVIYTEELQIGYIIQLVKPILDGLVSSVTVTPRATDAYNDLIHKRLSRSVFMDCVSWYRTGGGEGKVSSIFPGPMFLFGWWVRRPKWEDYNVKATTNEWERKVRFEKWMALLGPMYYIDILFGLFVSWISS